MSLSFKSDLNLTIEADTQSPATAEIVQHLLPTGIRMVLENEELKKQLPAKFPEKVNSVLQPQLNGNTVVISTK